MFSSGVVIQTVTCAGVYRAGCGAVHRIPASRHRGLLRL